ncbi:phage tail protein, partial [Vibrio cholerae]|nr:phage tail protein [Vibrio cholerae]
IKEGFTDKKPKTRWDKWNDGEWVTDLSAQYIAEFDQVDNLRRHLYFTMVDPLVSEANIKRLQGKEAEAIELERQAIAAREKIQLENPWPVNPEA